MTDAEIIKALECCFAKNIVCKECPYCGSYNCPQNLGKDTINLINRQKAEIERLTINMNAFGLGMKREKERADTAREEAIKEFAERLKEQFETPCAYTFKCITNRIDNLVKEMAGDTE